MKKKTIKNIGITFFVLLILVGALYLLKESKLTAQSIPPEGTFVKPLWASLRCEPDFNSLGSETLHVPTTGISMYCGLNEYTTDCDIKAINIPSTWWSGGVKIRYTECDNDGTNCDLNPSTVYAVDGSSITPIKNIKSGRKLFIRFERGIFNINVEGDLKKEYHPWKLFRYVGGGKSTAVTTSCNLYQNLVSSSNVLSDYAYPSKLTIYGGEGQSWINYVDDWAYGPGTNVFDHPQYGQVYCSNAQIYNIVQLQFKDGKLQKLDPTYKQNVISPDGVTSRTLNGLGNKITNVQCCPNEPTCGTDFKYKPVVQPAQCYSDLQCANAGNPIAKSGTTYTKWNCINSQCTESALVTVQCTSDGGCPSGQICDLSTTNYGRCIYQSGNAGYCGDNFCSALEKQSKSCDRDCKSIKSIEKKICPGGGKLLGFIPYPDLGVRERTPFEKAGNFILKIFGFGDENKLTPCTSALNYAKWTISLIIFLLSLFMIPANLSLILNRTGFIKNKGVVQIISWIFGIAIAVLIYVLIYNIFWLGFIIGVLLLALYATLKGISFGLI